MVVLWKSLVLGDHAHISIAIIHFWVLDDDPCPPTWSIARHTEHGLIITWARPGLQGLGTANPFLGDDWVPAISQETIGKSWENGGFMGFNGIYPLVMTSIAMENHERSTIFNGYYPIWMAIFNSYVNSPVGRGKVLWPKVGELWGSRCVSWRGAFFDPCPNNVWVDEQHHCDSSI